MTEINSNPQPDKAATKTPRLVWMHHRLPRLRNAARRLTGVTVLCWGVFMVCRCDALPIRDSLGMIESGNNDHAVGSAGEISRFQIKKDIWRMHSYSSAFWDQNEAWRIADKVLRMRADQFQRSTGREPGAFDIYVLWNAPGQFRSVGYQRARISPVVAERATRFANLVEQGELPSAPATKRNQPKEPLPADRSSPIVASVNGRN